MMVFALPVPMLYILRVPFPAKVALFGTFCLGIFTVVAGIMRFVAVIGIDFSTYFSRTWLPTRVGAPLRPRRDGCG